MYCNSNKTTKKTTTNCSDKLISLFPEPLKHFSMARCSWWLPTMRSGPLVEVRGFHNVGNAICYDEHSLVFMQNPSWPIRHGIQELCFHQCVSPDRATVSRHWGTETGSDSRFHQNYTRPSLILL